MPQTAAVFTDLDGSLRCSRQGIHALDLATLQQLGQLGIPRIIVTGRNLFAARKVLPPEFPIDYLIFSSGAGILDWHSQELLHSSSLSAAEAAAALATLRTLGLDCMLHHIVPDNHYFSYLRQAAHPDFEHRLRLYADFAQALPEGPWSRPCSQLLAIADQTQTAGLHLQLRHLLPDLSVIRATSPLDGRSGWLEIFPALVSKSQAAAWLCRRQNWHSTLAFGNDYNDSDLLAWADAAFVANDAPPELLADFAAVNAPAEAGFSQAVSRWLAKV